VVSGVIKVESLSTEAKNTEGHRKRLRKRVNESGLTAFLEYEITE
jgi:hypothetical protein